MLTVALLVAVGYVLYERDKNRKLVNEASTVPKQIADAKAEALKKQRSVVKGQLVEQIAPYLPEMDFDPADAKFLGQPIDFIVFEGMSKGEVTKVVISDVKTGNASLTKVQRQIRDAINRGDVEFHTTKIESIDGPVV